MKRHIASLAKLCVALAILAWLVRKESDAISQLVARPKDLRLLCVSFCCLLAATLLSFVRWFLLVRALEIPFSLREAIRWGFLGYLFNFIGPTSVGGDLIKAYFVARDQVERRGEAIATILIDRLVGLLSLLVVAAATILITGFSRVPELARFLQLVVAVAAVGTAGFAVVLSPCSDALMSPLVRLPFLGSVLERIRRGLALYRRRRLQLVGIGCISIAVHFLVAVAMHFTDRSVHPMTPTLAEHLIISTFASVAGAAPLPGGLGSYEFAMDYLFQQIPSEAVERGQGLSVAMIQRMLTIAIALLGVIYYGINRKVIGDALSTIEAERLDAELSAERSARETDREPNGR